MRFDRLVPLADGFAQIANYIQAAGRPLTSFCACELRSPAAFTEEDFAPSTCTTSRRSREWGPYEGTTNPVARSNVCPEIDPPSGPSFYAFAFTRPSQGTTPTFVIAGGAEARGGSGSYPERIVRYRDLSPEGLKEKVHFTVSEMERRTGTFGFGWNDTTGVQAYTIRDFHSCRSQTTGSPRRHAFGPHLAFCRPPVIDLEYEMDCRRVMREAVI